MLWYSNAALWWPILILTSVWKGAGYGSIVYFCALTGFDQSLYEAAEIDGANRWQRITRITLPLLKSTVIIMFLLNIGGILFGSVDQIMGMTNLNPLLPVPLRELSIPAFLIFPRRSPLKLLEYPYKSITVHKTGHLGDIGYF